MIGLLVFKRQITFRKQYSKSKIQNITENLTAYLALYVLEVVDSVDGSSAAVAGHTDSSATSDVVRDLSRIGFIFRPFSVFDGQCKLSSRPAYQFS